MVCYAGAELILENFNVYNLPLNKAFTLENTTFMHLKKITVLMFY